MKTQKFYTQDILLAQDSRALIHKQVTHSIVDSFEPNIFQSNHDHLNHARKIKQFKQ